jgi:hypothetical protein
MPLTPDSLSWTSWTLAAAAVLVIGVAKSGFGGGVGILAVPMFVVAMGPKVGLGAMLPLMIAADCLSVYHHRGTWNRQNLKVLAPGTLAGLLLGTGLLAWLLAGSARGEMTGGMSSLDAAERPMRIAIGLVCVFYVMASMILARVASHWRWQATWLTGTIAGVLAGVTSTLAHAAGPIMAIFFLGQHLAKQPFLGTTVLFFLVVNSLKLIPYAWLGMIDPSTLLVGLWLLPLVPLGTRIGAQLSRVMREDIFRRTIMVLVLLTGLKMVFG